MYCIDGKISIQCIAVVCPRNYYLCLSGLSLRASNDKIQPLFWNVKMLVEVLVMEIDSGFGLDWMKGIMGWDTFSGLGFPHTIQIDSCLE